MLDRFIRPQIAPHLEKAAEKISQGGIDDKKIIIASFILGLTGCFFAGMQIYIAGLLFLTLAMTGMGLSSIRGTTPPAWAFLRLMANFALFGVFVFLFSLSAPGTSMAAAFCIFGILTKGMAYTAHAMIAPAPGGGIIGMTETIAFIALCCVMPQLFPAVTIFFGLLCWVTAGMRVVSVFKALRN